MLRSGSQPLRANHLQQEAQADITSHDLDPRQAVTYRASTDETRGDGEGGPQAGTRGRRRDPLVALAVGIGK